MDDEDEVEELEEEEDDELEEEELLLCEPVELDEEETEVDCDEDVVATVLDCELLPVDCVDVVVEDLVARTTAPAATIIITTTTTAITTLEIALTFTFTFFESRCKRPLSAKWDLFKRYYRHQMIAFH